MFLLFMSRALLVQLFLFVCMLHEIRSFGPSRLSRLNLPRHAKLLSLPLMAVVEPPQVANVIRTSATLSSNKMQLLSDLLKRDIGSTYVRVTDEDSVLSAVNKMSNSQKSSILVFSAKDDTKLEGIFTERDFVKKIADADVAPADTMMSSVMTPASSLVYASPSMTLSAAQGLMVDKQIRHLPIVNDDDKVMGLISMREIIRALTSDIQLRERASLFGETLEEVTEQQKIISNQIALQEGEELNNADFAKTAFIALAASIVAGLLQATWVHDHEWLSMSVVFLLGYTGIIFENFFEFHKAAISLLMAAALWIIFAGQSIGSQQLVGADSGLTLAQSLGKLSEKVSETSEVVFFILGAMTIVEIVDAHRGFKVVTDAINSKTYKGLMWLIAGITFFMSAILDNLTTTILMVSLMKKVLVGDSEEMKENRKLFGALIVIAANAGGAWTPIGDVTTTMLWINGQISAVPTIISLFLPSLVSVILSTLVLQGQLPEGKELDNDNRATTELAPRGRLVFATGVAGLVSVPLFKATTGLPPYLGILASLGVLWTLTDAIHAGEREELKAPAALSKIDTSGVLFFLGILLSVGALDSAGLLTNIATTLEKVLPNELLLSGAIGVASAIIDNVPLVAATMGMYPLSVVPEDSSLWQLIAFCAGTGGSIFVIGSAAGVALMGLEKVDFLWYAKKVSVSAFVGYLGGIAVYQAQTLLQGMMNGAGSELATLGQQVIETSAVF